MIVELRRYHLLPGTMERMHARMADLLMPLFAASGIPRPRAIWAGHNDDGQPLLTWLLEWESYEARQAGWGRAIPKWHVIKAMRGEPEFVTRTELTFVEWWSGSNVPRASGTCESAWHLHPQVGFGGAARAACLAAAATVFEAAGVVAMNGCDLLFGALPQSILWLSWPDSERREIGLKSLAATVGELFVPASMVRDRMEPMDRATYLDLPLCVATC